MYVCMVGIVSHGVWALSHYVQVDLMDHPLHTITYVADIDRVLVIMAHILPQRPPPSQHAAPQTNGASGEAEEYKYIPKMTCHVLDSSNVCSYNTYSKGVTGVFQSPTLSPSCTPSPSPRALPLALVTPLALAL